MDFGLDRLLEMLEARYGRWPTDVMLIIIALAVFGFCVHQIWQYILQPVWGFAALVVHDVPLADIRKNLTDHLGLTAIKLTVAAITVVFSSLFYFVIVRAFFRSIYRVLKEHDAHRMRNIQEHFASRGINLPFKGLPETPKKYSFLYKLIVNFGRTKSEAPSRPLPPSTESKTQQ